jgi:lysylphosphatidylglycerol synthetase-like protein (DUF2156 family)
MHMHHLSHASNHALLAMNSALALTIIPCCYVRTQYSSCAERVAQLPAMLGLFGGEGRVANVLKQSVTAALSPLRAMPTLSSTEAWSFKQTAIAAQTFVLAATAHGEWVKHSLTCC